MKINILLTGKSYAPEAYAYKDYLTSLGWTVNVSDCADIELNSDVNLFFMGSRFLFQRKKNSIPEIHEYQSISTPPYIGVKNFIKKYMNTKPIGRVFLNDIVSSYLRPNDDVPFLLRDMGVDKCYFINKVKNIDYDLVYCGSISGRNGILGELSRLCSIGLKIIVIGDISKSDANLFNNYSNIEFTGRLSRLDIADVYSRSLAGLNYMPDIFPYNQQTSTKLIEYCASNLNIVSSSYNWVNQFKYLTGARFLNLADLKCKADFYDYKYSTPNVDHLEWFNLLKSIQFDDFVRNALI